MVNFGEHITRPRLPEPSPLEEIAELVRRLNLSGWSVGSAAFGTGEGRTWLVSGSNGENLLRAEGATELEVWQLACDEARAPGMLEAPPAPGAEKN